MTSSTTTEIRAARRARAARRSDARSAWSLFRVRPIALARLTPHLVRITFATDADAPGTSLEHFADNGYDQRIKLILPPAGGDLSALPDGPDWYTRLRALPDAVRPVVRTYTVRAVRAAGTERAEVDVDLVLHGTIGPASAWAGEVLDSLGGGASVDVDGGDEAAAERSFPAALLGPDARYDGWHGGLEFVTEVTTDLLIVGDETALPAIAGILERLPADATGTVLIEVPEPGDRLDLAAPTGLGIRWLPRGEAANGSAMADAALAWRPGTGASGRTRAAAGPADPHGWDEVAWEVPAAGDGGGIRAWVAGEASAVKTIRRHLVGPCGLDRAEVAFMGYWRLGRAEG